MDDFYFDAGKRNPHAPSWRRLVVAVERRAAGRPITEGLKRTAREERSIVRLIRGAEKCARAGVVIGKLWNKGAVKLIDVIATVAPVTHSAESDTLRVVHIAIGCSSCFFLVAVNAVIRE